MATDQQHHQSSSSSAHLPNHQQKQQQQQTQQNPPLLRRCSVSESHLDIVPHFFKEEKSLNPFNRVLSGLFDKGSNFSVNSTDSTDQFPSSKSDRLGQFPAHLPKGNSAIGMSSTPAAAATVVNADGMRKSATSASALYNGINNTSSSLPQSHHFPTIHEDHGLTMSAGRDKVPKLTNKDIPQQQAATSPPKSGFMNFFGTGGFLSRPVMHSPEENYRLIMALDR